MTINLITTIFLGIAGICLGTRQILLSGVNTMWPCAPPAVRVVMFLAAVALGGLAALFYGHHGMKFAGDAAVPLAAFSGIMAFYNFVMLVNMLGQRRPVHVWRHLNRAWAISCRPKPLHHG